VKRLNEQTLLDEILAVSRNHLSLEGTEQMKMDGARLKRKRYAMPDDVGESLVRSSLLQAYHDRPPYQQNDYIGWITRAKRDETRRKRIAQMLQELAGRDRYMKMPYKPKK